MTRAAGRDGVAGWAAAALRDTDPAVFWLDTADRPAAREPLAGPAETDLAVVGGGYSGLWTAVLTKQRDPGRDVVVVEAERVGWAASGRNGGFCSASLTHGYDNGVRRFPGRPRPARLGARVRCGGARRTAARAHPGLRRAGGRLELSTPAGPLTARQVAHGTNAFPSLLRRTRLHTVPVYDHVLVTEPLSAAQRGDIGWHDGAGVDDFANQFHYYRMTADGRILWGGYDAVHHYGRRVDPR